MRLNQTQVPASEPVSLDEAKNHLKVDSNDDNVLIQGLIATARQIAEKETHRVFITQEWELILDEGGDEIDIPKPPIQSVDSIKVITEAGEEEEVSSSYYDEDLGGGFPGRVKLKSGYSWPTHRGFASFIIAFTCGYGDNAADVPEILRQGILQLIGHLYDNRGGAKNIPKEIEEIFFLNKVLSV